jgi:hypothetical protein
LRTLPSNCTTKATACNRHCDLDIQERRNVASAILVPARATVSGKAQFARKDGTSYRAWQP